MDSELLRLARERVVVLDGAMGTSIQAMGLAPADFRDMENCTEVLVETRPDAVRDIHKSFLAVGCDAVLTNTFGANRIVLSEFDMADRVVSLNESAARLARQACDEFAKPQAPKFVVGSVGPGSRLPSLGQTTWDELLQSYTQQVGGLLAGGVDAVLVETCQDVLQAKAAIVAAGDAMDACGVEVPILCSVTIESTGTMLIGTDMAAAVTSLQALPRVAAIGLNCATGPEEMSEHVQVLGDLCQRLILVQPNAGLPEMRGGVAHYALTPKSLARWLVEFVETCGVRIVGGCCGTTPDHLAAVVEAMATVKPKPRQRQAEPAVSSLYQAVTIRQDTSVLSIGERTNANGSRQFRDLLAAENVDGMVQLARRQVEAGSHMLDVCVAHVGRNEMDDATRLVARLVTDVTAPLVIDSTDPDVMEAALKLIGGKCVINSINLEDGEDRLDRVCRLARRYGAALIALTIDEEGMAKTCARKVSIAKRIYELATKRHGISPGDLIFDPLTFTICTGNSDDVRLGRETLDGLEKIKSVCPGSSTVLGVSNISFGIDPRCRRVLNSVFLHYAHERGLDAAILNPTGIEPLYKIDDNMLRFAEDLLFQRRGDRYDPLQAMLRAVDQRAEEGPAQDPSTLGVEDRVKRHIIGGDRTGLEEDLAEAMLTYPPVDVINELLLDGMKTVGDLFGAGQMQLPFVLKSAETMKAAVDFVTPHIEQAHRDVKGTIVLATVRGDVHDIGKNLVDIILRSNGYTVVNLGIKQSIASMIEACQKHRADALGMSGLLVKSTLVMRENLEVLNERGVDLPVILGGAALTRCYVADELAAVFEGKVYYARDAFEGLHLMDRITCKEAVAVEPTGTGTTTKTKRVLPPARADVADPHAFAPPRSDISRKEPVPAAPFMGSRVVSSIELDDVLPYVNERALFQIRWQYHRNRRSDEAFKAFTDVEIRPHYDALLDACRKEDLLHLQAIYGFWPAVADGDALVLMDPDNHARQLERFEFPRQGRPPYWCISDFFRPVTDGIADVVALSMVTIGRRVSEVEKDWLGTDRFMDYFHLHGLSVELAEGLAEYVHARIRREWGIDGDDAADVQDLFKQHYRGSRYSFGYPACPRLEDQVKLWPLLNPERIGVHLSETFQLDPEQTTTAVVVHHKQARYFNVH